MFWILNMIAIALMITGTVIIMKSINLILGISLLSVGILLFIFIWLYYKYRDKLQSNLNNSTCLPFDCPLPECNRIDLPDCHKADCDCGGVDV